MGKVLEDFDLQEYALTISISINTLTIQYQTRFQLEVEYMHICPIMFYPRFLHMRRERDGKPEQCKQRSCSFFGIDSNRRLATAKMLNHTN